MDWLEAYSPMKVDIKNKWVAIPYAGVLHYCILLGIPELTVVQVLLISEDGAMESQLVGPHLILSSSWRNSKRCFKSPKDCLLADIVTTTFLYCLGPNQ